MYTVYNTVYCVYTHIQVRTMYQIISPAAIIVSGPSGCGKTTLIKDLIRYKKELFSIKPTRVVYYYAIYQSVFDSMPGVEFIQGRPMSLEPFRTDEHVLIIIDDQMLELLNDEITATLFISSCHHDCNSVIIVTPNIFHQGKNARTISLNAHMMFLFANCRDRSSIGFLARQMYPRKSGILTEAFEDATRNKPYHYLCVDLSPHLRDEDLRLRTHILPYKKCIVYKPL